MSKVRFVSLTFLLLLVSALSLSACIPPESDSGSGDGVPAAEKKADAPAEKKPAAEKKADAPAEKKPAAEKKAETPAEKKPDAEAPGLLPDLTIELTVPGSAAPGEVIGEVMTVLVNNVGGAVAPGKLAPGDPSTGFGSDIYIATSENQPPSQPMYDPSYSEYVLLQGGRANNTTDLAWGSTDDYSGQLSPSRIPADTPAGDYYICGWVDAGENVPEENETNNFDCQPITVGTPSVTGDFGITLASNCAVINPTYGGYTQGVVVAVERSGGHTSPVTLALGSSTTSGVTGSFTPATLSGSTWESSVLILTIDPATVANGMNTVWIEATDGVNTYTRNINLTVLNLNGVDPTAATSPFLPLVPLFATTIDGFSRGGTTIAAGGSDQYGHTLVVTAASSWSDKMDGQVRSSGSNGFGELGNNDFGNDSNEPVIVMGPDGSTPLEGIVAVAAGRTHGLALRADGTVWAWGWGSYGQLGGVQGMGAGFNGVDPDGNPITYAPFAVSTCGLTDIVAIAAGDSHSLALDIGGLMWSWGHNQWGALGDGTTDARFTPVNVLDPSGTIPLSAVSVIAAGHFHSLAVSDEDLFAWGKNEYGALGNNDQGVDYYLPDYVEMESGTPLIDIIDMDGGYQHSIAMNSAGWVYVWGDNYWGQLGDDTMDKTLPHDQQAQDFATRLLGPTSGVLPNQNIEDFPAVDVEAGADHSLIVTGSDQYAGCNSVFSFGWGKLGQNGNGLATERDFVPVEASSSLLGHVIPAVSAKGSHNVLLSAWEPYDTCSHGVTTGVTTGVSTTTVGSIFTWGDNREGQLGIGAGSGLPPCTLGSASVACETTTNMVVQLSNAIDVP